MYKPLASFKGAPSQRERDRKGRGREGKGKGEQGAERGRMEGIKGSWNRVANWV